MAADKDVEKMMALVKKGNEVARLLGVDQERNRVMKILLDELESGKKNGYELKMLKRIKDKVLA